MATEKLPYPAPGLAKMLVTLCEYCDELREAMYTCGTCNYQLCLRCAYQHRDTRGRTPHPAMYADCNGRRDVTATASVVTVERLVELHAQRAAREAAKSQSQVDAARAAPPPPIDVEKLQELHQLTQRLYYLWTSKYDGVAQLYWTTKSYAQQVADVEFWRRLRTANEKRMPHFKMTLLDWTPLEWAAAAAGEMGELQGVLVKMKRSQEVNSASAGTDVTHADLRARAQAEWADIIIYMDILAWRLGIEPIAAVRETFDKKSEALGSAVRFGGDKS